MLVWDCLNCSMPSMMPKNDFTLSLLAAMDLSRYPHPGSSHGSCLPTHVPARSPHMMDHAVLTIRPFFRASGDHVDFGGVPPVGGSSAAVTEAGRWASQKYATTILRSERTVHDTLSLTRKASAGMCKPTFPHQTGHTDRQEGAASDAPSEICSHARPHRAHCCSSSAAVKCRSFRFCRPCYSWSTRCCCYCCCISLQGQPRNTSIDRTRQEVVDNVRAALRAAL